MSKLYLEPQVLLLMMGHPAAGKSTMSKLLGKKVHIVHIDNDNIREPLASGDRESDWYKKQFGPGSYEVMYRLAQTNLLEKNSANIEVPHRGLTDETSPQRYRVHQIVTKTDSLLKIVFTQFREQDLQELKNRMEKRMKSEGTVRDVDKLNNWDKYVKKDILSFTYNRVFFSNVKVLNAVDSTEDNVNKIIDYLVSDSSCNIIDKKFDLEERLIDYCKSYLHREDIIPHIIN